MATLKDISKAAGTSISTASMILNGKQGHRFSEETRDTVLRIAAKLNYRPQQAAQSLVTGRTRNVALFVNSLANPFFGEYVSLVQAELLARGLTAIPFEVRSEEGGTKRDWLEWIDMRAFDAAIDLQGIVGISRPLLDTYRKFAQHQPLVLRESYDSELAQPYDRVVIDYESGMTELMRHLASMGYRQIGAVVVRGHLPARRGQGGEKIRDSKVTEQLLRLASSAGLNLPHDCFRGVDHEEADTFDWCRATIDLLRAHPEIEALIVHNINAVPAVLRGVDIVGRKVGTDLAMATFDDLPIARWLGPGITVVGEPSEQVAGTLVEMLLHRLEHPDAATRVQTVPSNLIVRGSTPIARHLTQPHPPTERGAQTDADALVPA